MAFSEPDLFKSTGFDWSALARPASFAFISVTILINIQIPSILNSIVNFMCCKNKCFFHVLPPKIKKCARFRTGFEKMKTMLFGEGFSFFECYIALLIKLAPVLPYLLCFQQAWQQCLPRSDFAHHLTNSPHDWKYSA